MKINITFIRHGITASNELHRYLGQTDEPLTEKGRELLKKNRIRYEKPDILLCSPLFRCRESAQILFPQMTPVSIPEWKEIDFGIFEGKTYQELNGLKAYQDWIDSGGIMKIPQGEGREQFCKRVNEGFEKCKDMFFEACKITCVVHGGTIMALLSSWTGKDYYDFQVKNGEGFYCEIFLNEEKVQILKLEKLEKDDR